MVERRTVRVGAAPHRHIAYSGPTRQVWVLNTGETSLSVLDGASAEPIGKVDLGGSPRHVILDDAAGLGYVSLAQDALAIVDIRANRLLETLSLPRGSRPGALQPMFGNRRLYVLLHGSPSLAVVDTRRNALAGSIPVGRGALWGQPWGSSYKPITRPVGKAYIANADSDDVTLFDDATDGVIARVAVGRRPSRNAIYRERGAIYVANALDNTVSAIRIADDTVAATVPVGTYPFRLLPVEAVNGRDELWVLNAGPAGRPAGSIGSSSFWHSISSSTS
jgi:YVTN family beta-propeller protein